MCFPSRGVPQPEDFTSFTSAVIDEAVKLTAWCCQQLCHTFACLSRRQAFKRIVQYIDLAKSNSELKILAGGVANNRWVYCIDLYGITDIVQYVENVVLFLNECFSRTISVSVYQN